MILAFSFFAGFGLIYLWANIGFLGTSRTHIYGKWAKKGANVISYFLMTSDPWYLDQYFSGIYTYRLIGHRPIEMILWAY